MHELSVAVINQVKEIKLRSSLTSQSRIVPKKIKNPIGVEESARFSFSERQPAVEERADARRSDRVGMVLLQFSQQHLCHQIHAGPILFDEIRDDGDSRLPICPHRAKSDLSQKVRFSFSFGDGAHRLLIRNQTWLERDGGSHLTGELAVSSN